MSDSHHDDEGPRYDDINTPVILIVGVISAVVTLITIYLVQGLCYHWQNDFALRNDVGAPANIQIQQQLDNLNSAENEVELEVAITKIANNN